MSVVSATREGPRRRSAESGNRYGGKVSQLKNIFQSEEDISTAADSGAQPRSTANQHVGLPASDEPSHVQRFRYTRAIFAAMEEKSRSATDVTAYRRPNTAPCKPRSASDTADIENIASSRSQSADIDQGCRGFAGYLGSLENLDDDSTRHRRWSRERPVSPQPVDKNREGPAEGTVDSKVGWTGDSKLSQRPQWLGTRLDSGAPPPSYSQHVQARGAAMLSGGNGSRVATRPDQNTSGAAVLLTKRRSRDEARLSKADIEASLDQADMYWNRGGEDHRMTESSISTGSGEARSTPLNTPTTPTTPPTPSISSKAGKPGQLSTDVPNGITVNTEQKVTSPFRSPVRSPVTTPVKSPEKSPLTSPVKSPVKSSDSSPTSKRSASDESHDEDYIQLMQKREDGDGHEQPLMIDLLHDLNAEEEGVDVVNQIWDQYYDCTHQPQPPQQRLQPVNGCEVDVFEDGNFVFEVCGLAPHDPDDDLYPSAKKPSRITFSAQPIKVYSTYSEVEYDRKNEDVDPMAASAEYELEKRVERMDVSQVELEKGPDGLGLSIIGMGVGADTGLEKLGIFIKTLTDAGAAQKDGRIKVNDQIIEVDGKSLVGVTQAYAASVLRNTSGKVRFLIGREKDPSTSEVARLIQQSLEQDRRRAALRDAQPPPPLPQSPPPSQSDNTPSVSDDKGFPQGAVPLLNTPDSLDSLAADSSSEATTPDMDQQLLFIKLKEAQYRNAVSDAELAKVRAKMILLENSESHKKMQEKKTDDMGSRLRQMEQLVEARHNEITNYQKLLEGSQAEFLERETQLNNQYTDLDKKYHKAKKLLKEYQQKEKEFLRERDDSRIAQEKKSEHFNAVIKALKERVASLERELLSMKHSSGVTSPLSQPHGDHIDHSIPDDDPWPEDHIAVSSPVKPVSLTGDVSELSSESEMSTPDNLPAHSDVFGSSMLSNGSPYDDADSLSSVPETERLDTSTSKGRAQMGSLAARRPPSRRRSSENSQDEDDDDTPFAKHDSDSTVRKNYKCKPSLVEREVTGDSPPDYSPPPIPPPTPPHGEVWPDDGQIDSAELWPEVIDRVDSQSDTSSVSQASYDPNQPLFSHLSSEISDTLATPSDDVDDDNSTGIVLVSSKPRPDAALSPLRHKAPAPAVPKASSGVTLISKKPLVSDFTSCNSQGVMSSRSLTEAHGDGPIRHESAHELSLSTPAITDGDPTDASISGRAKKAPTQFQTSPVAEWSSHQVSHWLLALGLQQYAASFRSNSVDGQQLLQLDGNRLKILGVNNAADRSMLKKKLKDLRAALERERKQHEREQKARDKLERQSAVSTSSLSGKKKKFTFGK